MSKYKILKNSNFSSILDDNENPTVTGMNTATTTTPPPTITPAYNEDNSGFFHDEILLKQNSVHQQWLNFQNHSSTDDHSHHHETNHIEDLIQYKNNNSIDNNNQNIYKRIVNSAKETSSINLDSLCTDDSTTMEIPLLQQQNCKNDNKVDGDRSNNYNNNKHPYDLECVCLCKQKGFASNLNSNTTRNAKSKILWAIALCCIFMVVEFLGGYLAGSLAIMADAAHLASDCISFVIGLVAIWLGCKPPDGKMSFGYKRFEVMGAIVSILGIWILTASLVLMATQRIYSNHYDLDANTMMVISGIGILINIIMIFILHTSVLDLPASGIASAHGHSHSHNHNGHHGHSHSHKHSPSNIPTPTYRPCSSNESGHLHTEYDTGSLLPTERDTVGDIGAVVAIDADAIDTAEATSTSIELSSPPPMVSNGNLLKHHQQEGNEKNLNLRAAMIHVIGDLVQSFGVFFAAVLIKIFPKAAFLDPLCTLLFSIIVIMTTVNLFKESMYLIMDAVPQGLSRDCLEMDLLNIEGVKSVHHLNVWNHTSNYSILMAHLVIDTVTDSNAVLMKATQLAGSEKYNIKHSTIQVERLTT